MSQIVYLNGQYIPRSEAKIDIEDRGFMFADGVYEVVRFYNHVGVAMADHLERLHHSLKAIRMSYPAGQPQLDEVSAELGRRNNLPDFSVYWQVTRGASLRKHTFPPANTPLTILAIAYEQPAFVHNAPVPLLKAITRQDVRWHHCEIKAVSLLANVLDSQAAADAGCQEAILIRQDCNGPIVTEGTSRSIFVAKNGVLHTYPLDGRILDSITRRIVLQLCREHRIQVIEKPFGPDLLASADEVIAVGTTTEVAAILSIDGKPVADGKTAGKLTTQLWQIYRQHVAKLCDIK